MSERTSYLLNLKDEFKTRLTSLENSMNRQALVLFWASVSFLAIYFLEVELKSVTILGVSAEHLEFSKLLVLVPIIISYQFSSYSFAKLNYTKVRLSLNVVLSELDHLTNLDWKDLCKRHVYVSGSGTVYRLRDRDVPFSMGVRLLRSIRWLPVLVVFALGAFHGSRVALRSQDQAYAAFYFLSLALSVSLILGSRLSVAMAYRTRERKPMSSIREPREEPIPIPLADAVVAPNQPLQRTAEAAAEGQ